MLVQIIGEQYEHPLRSTLVQELATRLKASVFLQKPLAPEYQAEVYIALLGTVREPKELEAFTAVLTRCNQEIRMGSTPSRIPSELISPTMMALNRLELYGAITSLVTALAPSRFLQESHYYEAIAYVGAKRAQFVTGLLELLNSMVRRLHFCCFLVNYNTVALPNTYQ